MREIKFRFFDGRKMYSVGNLEFFEGGGYNINDEFPSTGKDPHPLMQYTGLKDKNGLQEVYEGDIIDTYGNIKGNIYEIKEVDKERYDLVIQGFGTKDWLTTYQNAVDRGCKDSE